MPQNVSKYFETLGSAKKYADECATRDNSDWLVTTSSDYGHSSQFATGEVNMLKLFTYSGEKVVYRAKPGDPNKITIELTKDEMKEWQEYLETERPALRYFEGFKGGMYATPVEKTLISKLKGLISV